MPRFVGGDFEDEDGVRSVNEGECVGGSVREAAVREVERHDLLAEPGDSDLALLNEVLDFGRAPFHELRLNIMRDTEA